ncbi:MAG: radical SAM protein, partial [Candidatus Omnitrophica bacterium]|nr:radical SAM protein [Candidatus Omnitrophota bacterium]
MPYARGRARSREFPDILKEAQALTKAGHKEVIITGINVGTYQYENKNLIDVIDALENIQRLERIRISSIEPTTIPEIFVQKMSKFGKLCRYLHIPIQSGSDPILTEMKRRYTLKEFDAFIQHVHDCVPDVCIGTDVIVGFPGE